MFPRYSSGAKQARHKMGHAFLAADDRSEEPFQSSLDPASRLSILRGFRRTSVRVDINDFKDLPYVRGHPHGRKTV